MEVPLHFQQLLQQEGVLEEHNVAQVEQVVVQVVEDLLQCLHQVVQETEIHHPYLHHKEIMVVLDQQLPIKDKAVVAEVLMLLVLLLVILALLQEMEVQV
tara:strand:- start:241 stop:540 length:300 start_codon:yes stop_codon:yes gene_type:complete